MGGKGYGGGGRGRVYTYRYIVTTRMTCIKMGSDESHFNVSLIVRDKVTNKTVSTNHNFRRERRAEAVSNRGPSAYQPNAFTARPNRLTMWFASGHKAKGITPLIPWRREAWEEEALDDRWLDSPLSRQPAHCGRSQ